MIGLYLQTKFNSSNINNKPLEGEPMVHARNMHACSTFSSALHDGRPIIIVAGSWTGSGPKTAEILDFTKEGTSWQKSNLILILYHMFLS